MGILPLSSVWYQSSPIDGDGFSQIIIGDLANIQNGIYNQSTISLNSWPHFRCWLMEVRNNNNIEWKSLYSYTFPCSLSVRWNIIKTRSQWLLWVSTIFLFIKYDRRDGRLTLFSCHHHHSLSPGVIGMITVQSSFSRYNWDYNGIIEIITVSWDYNGLMGIITVWWGL
jgi:hypothetical protein